MAHSIIKQVVIPLASMAGMSTTLDNILLADGTFATMATSPLTSVPAIPFGAGGVYPAQANKLPILINSADYTNIMVTLSSGAQTGIVAGSVTFYGTYPNFVVPAGCGELSYFSTNTALTAAAQRHILNFSSQTLPGDQADGVVLGATSVCMPPYFFISFKATTAPAPGTNMTVAIWGTVPAVSGTKQ